MTSACSHRREALAVSLLWLAMSLHIPAQPLHTAASTSSHELTIERQTSVYIENKGQWDHQARFLLRGAGLDMWITNHGVVYDIKRVEQVVATNRTSTLEHTTEPLSARVDAAERIVQRTAVFLTFLGAEPTAAAQGINRAPGYHNFFIGNDQSRWATNVPLYSQARIEKLYTGIDAVFYLDDNRPRYDLVVAPGADVSQVRMEFQGAGKMRVDEAGSLVIETALGEVRQRELFAYQIRGNERQQVECRFRIGEDGVVRFDIGSYDRRRALVIDPVVIAYSTYLGGTNEDQGYGIAVDDSSNIYITGYTSSTDFPTIDPAQLTNAGGKYDGFVMKLTSGGALSYSTYLGGTGMDQGIRIAADNIGNAYVTGITASTNFPTMSAVQSSYAGNGDGFVTKLTTLGVLSYSTYLGGTGDDRGYCITVDSSSNAYVTGYTSSTDFPTLSAVQSSNAGGSDGFVTKLTSVGVLSSSTYLGGKFDDEINSIAVDKQGNKYVTGDTRSPDFPTMNPVQPSHGGGNIDGFVTKLTAMGTLSYSTYLGGSGYDIGSGIVVDGSGSAYVVGFTGSSNFPTMNPAQPLYGGHNFDGFVMKLTTLGVFSYSTFLGGTFDDYGTGIAVDDSGNAYVTGGTSSTNFPTKNSAQSSNAKGSSDAFVSTLTPSGILSYSTSLGGSGNDQGKSITVNRSLDAYVAGYTGSPNFPTMRGADSSFTGVLDVFVTRFSFGRTAGAPVEPAHYDVSMSAFAINQTSDAMHLSFILKEQRTVTVALYTVDGRRIASPIQSRQYTPGAHVEHISTTQLVSGNYLLQLSIDGASRIQRFVVVR